MKQKIPVSLLIVLGLCAVLVAQNPQELYNKALIQERAAGNLEQAIQLYERVAKESTNDRALAARALIGAARSYERMGQTQASRSLYTQVARSFAEQQDQSAIARQRLAQTGVVQGTVLRAGTAEPVAGAKVTLSGGPTDPAALQGLLTFFKDYGGVSVAPPADGQADQKFLQNLIDTAASRGVSTVNPVVRNALDSFRAANDSGFSAASDSAGHFTIRDVAPGRYTILSDQEGFFPGTDSGTENVATVVAGRTSTVDVSMVRGATIRGRITDAAGQPMPNTTVQAYSVVYAGGFPVMQPAVSKTTDDQGEYRLFWLTSGEYLIAVAPQLTGPQADAEKRESFAAGVAAGAAQIAAGGRGAAVPPPSFTRLPSPRTFYPGTADVSMAIPVIVRGDTPISGIDVMVRNVSTYRLTGEIHSNVTPPVAPAPPLQLVEGKLIADPNAIPTVTANMALRSRNSNTPDDIAPLVSPTVTLHPSGNQYVGQFDIRGVPPGAYELRVWTNESNPDRGGPGLTFADVEVDVYNQDVGGLSLDIYPSVRVNGAVTIDGTAPGQTTVRVSLQVDGPLAKAAVYQGIAARAVVADSQTGAFMIPAVTFGHFRVQIGQGLPPELYVADVRQNGHSVFDSGFDVGRESPAPIQVMLNSGARTVEGIVKDAAGKPAVGVTAVLVPPPARRQNRVLYRTAKTDASGRFKITGVAPGDYSLFSWQNIPDGAYYNDRFVSRNADAGRKVNVAQASMTGADITLIPSIGR